MPLKIWAWTSSRPASPWLPRATSRPSPPSPRPSASRASRPWPAPRQKTSRWPPAPLQFADRARIHVFLASSDLHLEYKLKIGRAEALDLCGESVRLARSLVDDVEFSPEDATRSDRDFLVEMVRIAVEAGATTINMPDTVGYSTPEEYGRMFREVRERIPAIDAAGHHPLFALPRRSRPGRRQLAGRHRSTARARWSAPSTASANAPATPLSKRSPPLSTCAATATASPPPSSSTKLYPTSEVLGQIITFKPSPNKAIVGANAFAHESGIHQHGMLANPLCYEIMTPPWSASPRRIWSSASTPAARRCATGLSNSASPSPAKSCSTPTTAL